MSEVRAELEKATGVKQNRGESDAEYGERLVGKIGELDDATWGKLSSGAQAWFNESCDLLNDGKEAVAFAAPAPAASTRNRVKAAEPAAQAPWLPQAGEQVIVTTKRNRVFEGEFIELDGDTAVVKVSDEEMEFTADRVLSMVPANTSAEEAGTVTVGSEVTLTTKRNAVISGKVLELTEEYVVLEVEGKEAEYNMARVASIVLTGADDGGVAEETTAAPKVGDWVKAVTKRNKEVEGTVVEIEDNILVLNQGREGEIEVDMNTAKSVEVLTEEGKPRARRETALEAPATRAKRGAAPAALAGKEKKVTAADNGGVSVTTRMREILCADPAITADALAKQLDKEKLVYKKPTMLIVFKEFNKIIELLKQNKHFK